MLVHQPSKVILLNLEITELELLDKGVVLQDCLAGDLRQGAFHLLREFQLQNLEVMTN